MYWRSAYESAKQPGAAWAKALSFRRFCGRGFGGFGGGGDDGNWRTGGVASLALFFGDSSPTWRMSMSAQQDRSDILGPHLAVSTRFFHTCVSDLCSEGFHRNTTFDRANGREKDRAGGERPSHAVWRTSTALPLCRFATGPVH